MKLPYEIRCYEEGFGSPTPTARDEALVRDCAKVCDEICMQHKTSDERRVARLCKCGPLTAQSYDTTGTTGYFAGEIIYETPGDGTYVPYLSLQSGNAQVEEVEKFSPSLVQRVG